MEHKSQRGRRGKSVPEWSADDERLANLLLKQWETGRIALGKNWKDEFEARVRQRFSSHEGFPGGGGGTRAESQAWVCKDRFRDRITHLREKAEKLFGIRCEILEEKHLSKTPDILRRIRDRSILPLLKSESKAIRKELEEHFPTALQRELKTLQDGLEATVSRLEREWRDRIRREVLAAEIELLESKQEAATNSTGERENGSNRRAIVDAYIEEVLTKTSKRITRTDIWKKVGYKTRTEFERWERNDPKATKTADERFTKILTEKPHLK